MSKKDDTIELVAPDGVSGDDPQDPPPPPQNETGGYAVPSSVQFGVAQPATGYRYDQPAMQSDRPAESYGYDQPDDGYTRPPPTVAVEQPGKTLPNYYALSCLICLFCSPIFGLVALTMSSMSQDAAVAGKMEEAKSWGERALYTSIAGAIFGMISIAVVTIYLLLHVL